MVAAKSLIGIFKKKLADNCTIFSLIANSSKIYDLPVRIETVAPESSVSSMVGQRRSVHCVFFFKYFL